MRQLLLLCLSICYSYFIFGQNLVPNGDFEKLIGCPKSLSELTVYNWNNTVAESTADIFSNCSNAESLANPSILHLQPYEGSTYLGLKPAINGSGYREYISCKLKSRLKNGRTYRVKIAVAIPDECSYRVNHIDFVLSSMPLTGTFPEDPMIDVPSVSFSLKNIDTLSKWKVYETTYVAEGDEAYLCIGNFLKMKKSDLVSIKKKNKYYHRLFENCAYVCLDAIEIIDVNAPPPIDSKAIIVKTIEEPIIKSIREPVVLDNLLFETASAQLKEDEIPDLDAIVTYLKNQPELNALIEGHTDNIGSENSNQILSDNRAKSVLQYLVNKGIDSKRLRTKGFGATQPIADNSSTEGRARNRRVVIRFE
jgi:outer membrane protein OmpA-like peptidoglycan-associated protein